jgi:hypothetical protein
MQRTRRFTATRPYDGHVTRCCVVEWLIIHAYAEGDTAAMSVAVLGPVKAAPPEFESSASLDLRQFVLQEWTRGESVRRKSKMISWIR